MQSGLCFVCAPKGEAFLNRGLSRIFIDDDHYQWVESGDISTCIQFINIDSELSITYHEHVRMISVKIEPDIVPCVHKFVLGEFLKRV